MTTGIIIGRFQGGLHHGHLKVIEKAIGDGHDSVHVFLGSSNAPVDCDNPFTFEQRMEMLQGIKGIKGITLSGLPDYNTDGEWLSDIIGRIQYITDDGDPSNVMLYCGEKDKEFYETHFIYKIVPVKPVYLGNEPLSGTRVRDMLYRKDPQARDALVDPASIVPFLNEPQFHRTVAEYFYLKKEKAKADLGHPYNNPVYPVVHACLLRGNDILMIKRTGTHGYGQWALPGGFLESTETSQAGAIRELKEETGIELGLDTLQLAKCVEENLEGPGVRTLGINYLFCVSKDTEFDIKLDEASEHEWFPFSAITGVYPKVPVFYNHKKVIERLLSTAGSDSSAQDTPDNEGTQDKEDTSDTQDTQRKAGT